MTIGDLVQESRARMEASGATSATEAQQGERRLIGHSESFRGAIATLHKYLYQHMYFREEVNWHVRRATELLGRVFERLLAHPDRVPERWKETADSPERAVCDYLQGMTDRYVETVARGIGVLPSY